MLRPKQDSLPPVAVLCGGSGERLKGLTQGRMPKCLVEIEGEPFLGKLLKRLATQQVSRVILCVAHQAELIRRFVVQQNLSSLFESLDIIFDSDESPATPLGTALAVRRAANALGTPIMVINGDTFLEVDFIKVSNFFLGNAFQALLVTTTVTAQGQGQEHNVSILEGDVAMYRIYGDIPFCCTDAGLYMFDHCILSESVSLPELPDVLSAFSREGRLRAYQTELPFYHLNTQSSVTDMKNHWSSAVRDANLPF